MGGNRGERVWVVGVIVRGWVVGGTVGVEVEEEEGGGGCATGGWVVGAPPEGGEWGSH
jgi:hypothetical protein